MQQQKGKKKLNSFYLLKTTNYLCVKAREKSTKIHVESRILSFGAERIVIHNTSKLLLEIKSFTQYKVIHIRLNSKVLHTLVQPPCEIHIDITDIAQWA